MGTEALKSRDFRVRLLFLSGGVLTLIMVYVFQRGNPAALVGDFSENAQFVINRATRLILNDVACLAIIYAVFRDDKYLKISFWLFLVEVFIVLPAYLIVKLTLEGPTELSSPLLSHVHRLIVNPMLMLLLMAGFVYQRRQIKRSLPG